MPRMIAHPDDKFLDEGERSFGRDPKKIIETSQPKIGMSAQVRRAHPGGIVDWLMNTKAIPFLSFKGIGILPMAVLWFFVSVITVAVVYEITKFVFRALPMFGVFKDGKNVWNGTLYTSGADTAIAATLFSLVIMLILTNIEYTRRLRVWILGGLIWITISVAVGGAWSDFYGGKVGLVQPYNWYTIGNNFAIAPSPNWFLIMLVSGAVAFVVFVPLAVSNWLTTRKG